MSSLKYGRTVLELEKTLYHNKLWNHPTKPHLLIQPLSTLSVASVAFSNVLQSLVFTSNVGTGYAHLDHRLHSMPETIEHRILRCRKVRNKEESEILFKTRPAQTIRGVWTNMPSLLSLSTLRVCYLNSFNYIEGIIKRLHLGYLRKAHNGMQ